MKKPKRLPLPSSVEQRASTEVTQAIPARGVEQDARRGSNLDRKKKIAAALKKLHPMD